MAVKLLLQKIIAGLEVPNSGEILLDGENITDWDITKRAKMALHTHFNSLCVLKGVTVRDLLNLAAERTLSKERYALYSVKSVFVQEIILKEMLTQVFLAVKAKELRLLPFYRVKMRRYLYLTSLRQVLTFGALQVLLTHSKNLKTKAENPCL